MPRNKLSAVRRWASLIILLLIFVAVSYFSRRYSGSINDFVRQGPGLLAAPAFVLVCALSVVIPPVASLPLVPVASQAWGFWISGILTSGGWIIGSIIAFLAARRYGRTLVERVATRDELKRIHEYIPDGKRGLFGLLVALQIVLPVDLLSYTVALLTRIPFTTFALATFIGNIPSGFGYAYLGALKLKWQLAGLGAGSIIAVFGLWALRRHKTI